MSSSINFDGRDRFRIGIVMAVYDCSLSHFKAQVNSLKNQDFKNWICLISDDRSPKEIGQQIASFLEGDSRFVYHAQEHNLGSYLNFEYGIRYFSQDSRITHLALADHDDIWHHTKLTKLLDTIEREEALLAHSDLELIDEEGNVIHPSVWEYERRRPEKLDSELLLLRNMVTGCTAMMQSRLIPHILPFPEQPQPDCWYHDYWIALVASHLGKIAHIREPLVQYRQHSRNLVGAQGAVGTIHNEFTRWLAKKGKVTLKSYYITRTLSQALYRRFDSTQQLGTQRCFPDRERIDFGLAILRLGIRSYLVGYGAQGTILRLLFNKIILDAIKVQKAFFKTFK